MKPSKIDLPDVLPALSRFNCSPPDFTMFESNLGIMNVVQETLSEKYAQHVQDLEDLFLNLVAYGIAVTQLYAETRLESNVNDPYTYTYVTKVDLVDVGGGYFWRKS